MNSKHCNIKGLQKTFYFTTNKISSCCRDYGTDLDSTKTLVDYTNMWQQESQQLSQGVELAGCKSCWVAEQQGKQSYRTHINQTVQYNEVEISVNNACNQMCSYCSPSYSSEWQKSIQTLGNFTHISKSARQNLQTPIPNSDVDYWLNQISDYVDQQSDHSVRLNLLGGEPLMQLSNMRHLLNFIKNKINIAKITTNLNPPDNKFLIWLVNNISVEKLKINVSIDACPNFNHVPRGLFDPVKFADNLQYLKQQNVQFEFNSVISVLSMFDIDNFLQWTNDNQYKTNFVTLNNPQCLEPDLLPNFVKQQLFHLIDMLSAPSIITDILSRPTSGTAIKWFEQYHYLIQYFDRVGIDPTMINNQLFQQWWHWLTNTVTKKYTLLHQPS